MNEQQQALQPSVQPDVPSQPVNFMCHFEQGVGHNEWVFDWPVRCVSLMEQADDHDDWVS